MHVQEIQPPPALTIPATDDDEALQLQIPYCSNRKHESLYIYKCLLGSLFKRKTFPAGSDIAVQGTKAAVVIYIEEGECEILFSDKHGDVDEDFEGSEVSAGLFTLPEHAAHVKVPAGGELGTPGMLRCNQQRHGCCMMAP